MVGNKTKLQKERTNTGIKDTIQEHFFDRLFSSYEKVNGVQAKQDTLDAAVDSLPEDITNPVWRLKGTAYIISVSLVSNAHQ